MPDLEALSRAAAGEFVRAARAAVRRRRPFRVALAGGTTPRRLYELLADPAAPYRDRIPWRAVHVFFGDERLVPPDHPDSNYRMARQALLSGVPIPSPNIHRIRGESANPARAARAYERVLRACHRARGRTVPRLDLVLLGMGADGHVASLFPGSPALLERRRLALPTRPAGGVPRITLTLPVLDAAARIVVLVSGDSKAGAAWRVLGRAGRAGSRDAGSSRRVPAGAPLDPPASLLRPRRGTIQWLVDRAAGRLLRRSRKVC